MPPYARAIVFLKYYDQACTKLEDIDTEQGLLQREVSKYQTMDDIPSAKAKLWSELEKARAMYDGWKDRVWLAKVTKNGE